MQIILQSTFILSRVVTYPLALINGSLLNLFVFPVLLEIVYYSQTFTVFSSKHHGHLMKILVTEEKAVKC